jgi:surface protein
VLAASNGWYKSSTAKSDITEIEIVREVPSDFHNDENWNASSDGKVMAYRNGTKLTIAGNGCRFIWCNSDSSLMFSDSTNSNWFSSLVTIKGAQHINTVNATDMTKMFAGCTKLESIDDISGWDTSNCTNMLGMFQINCSLQELDLSRWDVSRVKDFGNMFYGHKNYTSDGVIMKLTSVGDLSGWNTGSATNMSQMFNYCICLRSVDVSGWDVSGVTADNGLYRTFAECWALKEMDFSRWDTSNVKSLNSMLSGTNLEKITIGDKFDLKGSVVPTPAGGTWYDFEYNPVTITSKVARTYFASKDIAKEDNDKLVFVKNGTLRKIAESIRKKNGKNSFMLPSEFADEVLALQTVQS